MRSFVPESISLGDTWSHSSASMPAAVIPAVARAGSSTGLGSTSVDRFFRCISEHANLERRGLRWIRRKAFDYNRRSESSGIEFTLWLFFAATAPSGLTSATSFRRFIELGAAPARPNKSAEQ